jgi:hypothetical protein
MLEAVTAAVGEPVSVPRILCGDFKVPQAEMLDGRSATWADRVNPNAEPRIREQFRGGEGKRWDYAERTMMNG